MARFVATAVVLSLTMAAAAPAQGPWIIEDYTLEGPGWTEVPGGGYGGTNYHYATGYWTGRRASWSFDFPDVPAEPRLYRVEQWIPSVTPGGVTWGPLPIEVTFVGDRDFNEEGRLLWEIPWIGWDDTNHQWIDMAQSGPPGAFQAAGPGPQAPEDQMCDADPNGDYVWLQKGSVLYTKWQWYPPLPPAHAVTALRITDANQPPPEGCGPPMPEVDGALDLRTVGNADPLYGRKQVLNEAFYNNKLMMVRDGDATLGVEDYKDPRFGWPPLPLGLPYDMLYTAHLASGDVSFVLRYDGLNTIKWRTDNDVPELGRDNVFTLNDVPGQEFEEGNYDKLYFLTTKSGGHHGELIVEADYDDATTESFAVKLYEWFYSDGDSGSLAVGIGGELRSDGTYGFRRINTDGAPANDPSGSLNGAYMFVHPIDVDENKILSKVRLSIVPDERNGGQLNGSICVFAATFIKGLACNTPVFDADGDADVDHDDFGAFQACFTGQDPDEGVFDWENCGCLDVDEDEDVDENDYDAFEACASGPDVPADPACDDTFLP